MLLPFAPFEPDKSPFETGSSASVLNALPVANGWGPMPGLIEVSAALPSPCRGSCFVRDAAGNYAIIAGTATALYRLDVTDFTWEDISGPSAPYNVPLNDSWTFTRFGNQLLAHTLGDDIQVYDIDGGLVFGDLAGSPPKARYSWVAGDFVVLGYLENGATSVRWCGINNVEWWTIGKQGSDFQELPEGDEVMGGFGDTGGFVVIQRGGMQFFPFALDSGFTFTRQVLNPKQGTVSPRSIVSIGPGRFFYLSEDGFFGGVNREPIGAERVDRWFMDQVEAGYLSDVQGAADPFEKIVWWKYRVADGNYGRLGYDWQLDRWCTSEISVGEMVSLTTPDISWDKLDMFYSSIEEAAAPYDSRLFVGGRPTMAGFDNENKLVYFAGANLEASIETGQAELDAISRTFINAARVTTDALDFTLSDGVADYHGGTLTWSVPSTPNRAGLVPFRSDGRLHKLRLVIAEGATWSIAGGVNANAQVSGEQ